MEHMQRASFSVLTEAMNFASIELCEVVGWNQERYTTGSQAKYKQSLEMDLRWETSSSQSESTKPTAWSGEEVEIVTL